MKWVKRIALVLVIFLVLAQLVRPAKTNPPVVPANELQAPAPVISVLQRSCNDCHSNRTAWPWYAEVAPASWLLIDDVKDGREELNFSDWMTYTARRKARKLQEVCEQLEEGEMPLKLYLPLHPDARLSDADRRMLCDWAKSERARIIAEHPEAAAPPRR